MITIQGVRAPTANWLRQFSPSIVSWPKRSLVIRMSLSDGKYHVINMSTGGYAALADDSDQSDVITISVGLREEGDRGFEVRSGSL